jgi:enhancer of mRNA-decapping protein 4
VGGLSAQKGVTERMFPQLEKSVGAKLEGTVTRQLQTQFQTIGRQALQVRSLCLVIKH